MPVPFTTGYSTFEEINSPTKHYTNHTELQEKDKRRWRLLIPTCLWFPPASPRAAPVLLPRSPSASRSRSGTPSLSGLGVFIFSPPQTLIFRFFFEIPEINFLLFFLDIVVDNCAICRNHIMDLCKKFISN